MIWIRFSARGIPAIVALLTALILLPYLFADTLSPQEAERLIRKFYESQTSSAFLAQRQKNANEVNQKLAEEWIHNLEQVRQISFKSIRVRRGLLVPPFAKRTTFLIEVRRQDMATPQYFRISQGIAYETSAFWWYIRL